MIEAAWDPKVPMLIAIPTVMDDGGRQAAGLRGHTGDCAVRACAIATGVPYKDLYDAFKKKNPGNVKGIPNYGRGTPLSFCHVFLNTRGFEWFPIRQEIGKSSPRFNTASLPMGTIVVSVPRHMVCVVDHVAYDTFALPPSTPVIGYWKKSH